MIVYPFVASAYPAPVSSASQGRWRGVYLAAMLEIRLLGQFDLRLDGTPIPMPARAAQLLLAYLSLSPGVAHRREKLAGRLWPDVEEAAARRHLRQALWRLRKALGPTDFIIADESTVAFKAQAPYWLDAHALTNTAEALSLYTGELLPGFYDEWVLVEREQLRATFDRHMQRWLEQQLAEQCWPVILEWGERWIAFGHSPEPAYRAVMLAHAHRGDMARTSDTYQRCLNALHHDFGVDPSPETRVLYQQLLTRSAPVVTPRPTHNLPQSLTTFIGRGKELAELQQQLTRVRLLTLTGAGGTGKTRLALQAAAQATAARQFPDGVWLIELAAVANPTHVPQTVAAVLGVREMAGQPLIESMGGQLRDQHVLLVLDNCEHLIEASAHMVEALLRACPHLTVLATSRERLNIAGESLFPVPALSLPDTTWDLPNPAELLHFEALQLFCDRAAAAAPHFALTPHNSGDVAIICRQLDGIPLAIELAAARVSLLAPAEIAARLNDVFRAVGVGHRTDRPRHQTLRAAIEWSYNLLTPNERAVLRQLAVFSGTWTLEAAQAICGDEILEVLESLEHKSLVTADHPKQPETQTRYHLLEMLRQYAQEKLVAAAEAPPARQRHLTYYLHWVERVEKYLRGPNQAAWLAALHLERDNLRTALTWAIQSDSSDSLRLAGALGRLWYLQALAQSARAESPSVRAKTFYAAGLLALAQGHSPLARSLLEESAGLFDLAHEPQAAAQSRAALAQ